MRSFARSLAAAGLLAVLAWALVAGPGATASGPVDLSWSSIDAWYQQVGPGVAVISMIRSVAVLLCSWLLVVAVLQAIASVPLLASARPAVDLVTPRHMQRLLQGVAGMSFAAAVAVPAPLASVQAEPSPDVAVMQVIEDDAPASTPVPPPVPATTTAPPVTVPSVPTSQVSSTTVLAPAVPSQPTTAGTPPVPEVSPVATPLVPLPAAVTPTAVVQGGDSFWSIAEAQLQLLGRVPTDREVARYWERLVAANVAQLADPGNPDLLYPGQILELPPV